MSVEAIIVELPRKEAEALLDLEAAFKELPEAEQRAYKEAQQSVVDARRFAEANAGGIWIV